MKKIKILHYVPGYNYGGIESFTYNLGNELKDYCDFYYLVENNIDKNVANMIEEQGATIIKIPNMTKDGIWKHILAVKKIFKKNTFDVVHVHDCNNRFFVMMMAKIKGVKKRIYHAHSKNTPGVTLKNIVKKIGVRINVHFSNQCLVCSEDVAKDKKFKDYIIIGNGIDTKKYCYNKNDRKRIRKKYNIPDSNIVLLFVGRLEKIKNTSYLIEVMKNIPEELRNKYNLLVVGDGEDLNFLKAKAKNSLMKNLIFIGKTKDVAAYYSASDIFCLPSLAEGFSIVLLEAQANGLECIVSKNVPKVANVCKNVCYFGIEEKNIKTWVKKILEVELAKETVRKKGFSKVVKKFDFKTVSDRMLKIYVGSKA